jgi:hypothetical protein
MAKVPTEYLLMPAPLFRTTKGDFTVDEAALMVIAEEFAKDGVQLPIYFDHPEDEDRNSKPAAGYFDVDVRDDGVWAVNVRWRDDIAEQIAAGGWQYDSPEFYHTTDDLKRVIQVTADALVHNPASISKRPITASKAAREDGAKLCHACASKSFTGSTEDGGNQKTTASTEGRNPMSDAIIKALAVKDEAEAIVAISEMKASKANSDKAVEVAEAKASKAEEKATAADKLVADAMKASGCEDRDKFLGELAALREQASKAEEAGKELAKIQAEKDEAEKAGLIEAAKCSKAVADFLSEQPLEVVKAFAEKTKDAPEVPTGSQSASASNAPAESVADKEEFEAVKAMCMKAPRFMDEKAAEEHARKHMEARKRVMANLGD